MRLLNRNKVEAGARESVRGESTLKSTWRLAKKMMNSTRREVCKSADAASQKLRHSML